MERRLRQAESSPPGRHHGIILTLNKIHPGNDSDHADSSQWRHSVRGARCDWGLARLCGPRNHIAFPSRMLFSKHHRAGLPWLWRHTRAACCSGGRLVIIWKIQSSGHSPGHPGSLSAREIRSIWPDRLAVAAVAAFEGVLAHYRRHRCRLRHRTKPSGLSVTLADLKDSDGLDAIACSRVESRAPS